ncbi:AAA family ATPase [Tenacibaculum agarivorans]|uniref:AAA family ATPase n=1 Tax=Tenacibaculum agarivorans TaxID=1908389 RepID=UPI00094BB9BF|nr:AAA family ATPase [Tenacibaculum agarivorans]
MASEVDQIISTMAAGNHFLLNGGAGSGKTHTLIELIQRITEKEPKAKIACITYTNVAADEITERANSFSLKASTIHDFLWDNIKGFQTNLRDAIIELNEDVSEEELSRDKEIKYLEYKSLKKGVISHNEVLQLAKFLFIKHPLLSKIINDKFDYIFVDEYQDTSEEVIDILLTYLNKKELDLKIGLFGDSMQSIYDGIGKIKIEELEFSEHQKLLKEVPKKLNRRNPRKVLDIANQLRNDGLTQEPAKNIGSPNIKKNGTHKEGNAIFLYSSLKNKTLKEVLESDYCSNWDFENDNDKEKPLTKILFTRNSQIAKEAEFNSLFQIYEKDKIIGGSGYVKRIKDFLKANPIEDDINSLTFLELLDRLTKKYDEKLDIKKALKLVENEKKNKDTTQKAINAVKKVHPGIEKILPARTMCDFIFNNKKLFETALNSEFQNLANTYINKDKLIGKKNSKNSNSNKRNDERDVLIKHLYKIQEIITLYKDSDIIKLIKKVDFKIQIGKHKILLKDKMDNLCLLTSSKIEDILDYIETSELFNIDSRITEFIEKNPYLIERIKRVSYSEIENLYNYTEGLSSYSTQHGVKGDEFDNVLVVINKDKISQLTVCYKTLFEGDSEDKKYYDRTLNLFYVACTRAKEDLVVFYEGDCSDKVIIKAREWFGKSNVIDLDKEV